MQGRVGPHHPPPPVAGSDLLRQKAAVRPPLQQQDGPAGPGKQGRFFTVQQAVFPHSVQIRHHQGKGPVPAHLAPAQGPHGGGVMGVAAQMEAAQTLHRHDLSLTQGVISQLQRIAGQLPPGGVGKAQPRAADRTGYGLGVEPPVQGIAVFRPAGGAQVEPAHRGQGPVVGQALDDGEARPAVGAVGERVAVAAGRRIPQLGQAVLAGGHIRGYQRLPAAAGAVADAEIPFAQGAQPADPHFLHRRQTGRLLPQVADEGLHLVPLPFRFHRDPGGMVIHPAGKRMLPGQPVDEGTEAHSLHDAADFQTGPDDHAGSSPASRDCI